jgi:DNA-binding response OmpR family regulator
MRKFNKNRTRLLVICKDDILTNDFITLLTGYGYYVDYVRTLKEGVDKFKQHKQAIVILDATFLPEIPTQTFQVFRFYSVNAKILIAATKEEEQKIYPYLDNGVYDIIQVPLRYEYLDFNLRRLVDYDMVSSRYEYLKFLMQLVLLSSPIWIYFIIIITRQLL